MTSGGGHTQTPAALSACGGLHTTGRTHSLPCSTVPSGQTQVFGAAPGTSGGGHTQTPSAFKICGGVHCLRMGTHSLPCNCVPGRQTQEFGAAPAIMLSGQIQEFGVGPAIIGGVQTGGLMPGW